MRKWSKIMRKKNVIKSNFVFFFFCGKNEAAGRGVVRSSPLKLFKKTSFFKKSNELVSFGRI